MKPISHYIEKYEMTKDEAENFKERVAIKIESGLLEEKIAIRESLKIIFNKRQNQEV